MKAHELNETLRAEGSATKAPIKRVGKYRVDELLGRGSFGLVYKGYDEQIDRLVAIKTLRPEVLADLSESGETLKRFAAEIRSVGRCAHPNIVTVFDYVEDSGAPHIIMEYVPAGTLDNVIKSGVRLPIRQVGAIMEQLLLALDHAHAKGVIHRDIKPSNILCHSAGSIKVADFGTAHNNTLELTRSGGAEPIGTPYYTAPERFLGRSADARGDVYSAGVILYQLLTGQRPFVAADIHELMSLALNQEPQSILSFRPDLWESLDEVVQRSLARNPQHRFQSALSFLEALRVAVEAGAVDRSPPLDLTACSTLPNKRPEEGGSSSPPTNHSIVERAKLSTPNAVERTVASPLGSMAKILGEYQFLRSDKVITWSFAILGVLWGGYLGLQQIAGAGSILDRFENLTIAYRYLLVGPRQAPRGVVIAAIDDETVHEAGAYPPPRDALAKIVKGIAAFQPQAIALDIAFLDAGKPDGDTALAEALRSTRTVVAAVGLFDQSRAENPQGETDALGLAPAPSSILWPIAQIRDATRTGLVNIATDANGVPEYIPLIFRTGDRIVPSLALAGAAAALNTDPVLGPDTVRLAARATRTDLGYHLPIHYYGPGGSISRFSAARVLRGDLEPDEVRGQIVLLGTTAVGAGDTFSTPFDPLMPGVEVLATGISNLLSGDGLIRTESQRRIDAAAAIALPVLTVLFMAMRRAFLGLALAATVVVLWIAFACAAFDLGYWFSIAVPLAACLPVAAGCGVLRLGLDRYAYSLQVDAPAVERTHARPPPTRKRAMLASLVTGVVALVVLLGGTWYFLAGNNSAPAAGANAPPVLKEEPPMGALLEGQRVLVDDGSCGPGQIKEVIGGNHWKVGGTKTIERQRRCIPR